MRPVTTRLLLTLLAASALAVGLARSAPAAIGIPTETTLFSSDNPSAFGQPVTFTATVVPASTGGGTPTGTVVFFDDDVSLGTASLDAGGQAFITTADLSVGSHAITAQFADSFGFLPSRSDELIQVVNSATGQLSITINSLLIKAKEDLGKVRLSASIQLASDQRIDPREQAFSLAFYRFSNFPTDPLQFLPTVGDAQPGTNFELSGNGHFSLTKEGEELTGYNTLSITLDPWDSSRADMLLVAKNVPLGDADFPLVKVLMSLGQNTGDQVVELTDLNEWHWRHGR